MPAHTASTRSFTFTSRMRRTSFTSASGMRANATLRPREIESFHGVRGAVSGTAPTPPSGSRRLLITFDTLCSVRPTSGIIACDRRAFDAIAYDTNSRSLGTRSGSRAGNGSRAGGSASRSNSSVMISAPDAPSIAAWCTLVTMPIRSCLRPSITHASHRGRVRSSGIDAICAAMSASSRRPPGEGTATRRT